MICRLMLALLLLAPPAGAQGDPDAPARPAWERWLEDRQGADPFEEKAFANGIGSLRIPSGWTLVAERRAGTQWIVALPPGADASKPTAVYKLVIQPVPKETPAAALPALTSKLIARLKAGARGARSEVGDPRMVVVDGQSMSELALRGKIAGVVTGGRVRARSGERSLAVSEQWWPADRAAAFEKLYDHIDASLAFRLEVAPLGWALRLPASWSYEAGTFGNQKAPSVTLAPRRLRKAADPGAVRLITTMLASAKLAAVTPTTLADNVALNYSNEASGFVEASRGALALGPIPGARVVLRGPSADAGRAAREMWVIVAKRPGATTAQLWIVVGDSDQVARDRIKLDAIIASVEAVERPSKPASTPPNK